MRTLLTFSLITLFMLLWACSEQHSTDPAATGESSFGKSSGDVKGGPSGVCPNIYYTSSKTLKNGATVTWTSSFGGFNYSQGSDYTITVTWSVVNGTANFQAFKGKKKTLTPPKDVWGTWSFNESTDELTVTMTGMHRSIEPTWQGYIGNGHFKLELVVTNANGPVKAKLGVNVHLEDPDSGYLDRCP